MLAYGPDAELAANLSTFFVGYTAFQVPGSVVAQRYGGKGVLTASIAGSAVVFGLLPAAAQRWRAVGSAGALFAAGVVQSFFTPGLAQINRDWLRISHTQNCPYGQTFYHNFVNFLNGICGNSETLLGISLEKTFEYTESSCSDLF